MPSANRETPFARLAMTHGFGMAGEASLALALASTLFFEVDPAEGREKVLLGLVLTMAPFALVGPFIGPLVDRVRGGHRSVIVGSMALRTVIAVVMIPAAAGESLLLFPQAFAMLVLAKTYQIAKAAVVPTVIGGDEALVEANSKLQLFGGISGFVGAAPAGICFLIGPGWVMACCAVYFAFATVMAWRLPAAPAKPAPDLEETAELHSLAVFLDASSMAMLRAIVGFSTFVLAFALRAEPEVSRAQQLARNVAAGGRFGEVEPLVREYPTWYFGAVVAMGVLGGLIGSSLAPRLRQMVQREEQLLMGSLGLVVFTGLWGAMFDGLIALAGLALGVAVAASSGKQAFDAVVQRDAPEADRGRLFARFEARFQVAWVMGALVPVAIELSISTGAAIVAVLAGIAIVSAVSGGFGQRSRSSSSSKKSGTSMSPSPSTST